MIRCSFPKQLASWNCHKVWVHSRSRKSRVTVLVQTQRVERGFLIPLSICRAHSNSIWRSDVLIVDIRVWFYHTFEILRQITDYSSVFWIEKRMLNLGDSWSNCWFTTYYVLGVLLGERGPHSGQDRQSNALIEFIAQWGRSGGQMTK